FDPSVSGVEGASRSVGADALQVQRQRKPSLQRGQERSPDPLALELGVDIDVMDEGLRYPHRQEPHETTFRAVTNEYGLALRRAGKVRIGFDSGRKPRGAADGALIESLDSCGVRLLELTDRELDRRVRHTLRRHVTIAVR